MLRLIFDCINSSRYSSQRLFNTWRDLVFFLQFIFNDVPFFFFFFFSFDMFRCVRSAELWAETRGRSRGTEGRGRRQQVTHLLLGLWTGGRNHGACVVVVGLSQLLSCPDELSPSRSWCSTVGKNTLAKGRFSKNLHFLENHRSSIEKRSRVLCILSLPHNLTAVGNAEIEGKIHSGL